MFDKKAQRLWVFILVSLFYSLPLFAQRNPRLQSVLELQGVDCQTMHSSRTYDAAYFELYKKATYSHNFLHDAENKFGSMTSPTSDGTKILKYLDNIVLSVRLLRDCRSQDRTYKLGQVAMIYLQNGAKIEVARKTYGLPENLNPSSLNNLVSHNDMANLIAEAIARINDPLTPKPRHIGRPWIP